MTIKKQITLIEEILYSISRRSSSVIIDGCEPAETGRGGSQATNLQRQAETDWRGRGRPQLPGAGASLGEIQGDAAEMHFAEEAKRLSDLAELLEKQKREEIVEEQEGGRVSNAGTETGVQEGVRFVRSEPAEEGTPPRISADEPCPISGVQKLAGEDLGKQGTDAEAEEPGEGGADSHALQLAEEQEERRRKAVADLKEDNKTIAEEFRDMNLRDKISDDISKKKDIEYNIRSDLLSEDPNVARSSFGPNRVVPDRWKG
ncbi:RIB43A-like with coiled-coils protein 2 [Caerostris extrusa]|uniref:RIB43A-like with coiled-coils protein 2 n=1 Tax=Caerostris extrusa TaxID=172846 RepID=A0AAV4P5L1_CAEEX|nr:RIB43A-like with coiled-coils protein 2 [Caerostris extrusa]